LNADALAQQGLQLARQGRAEEAMGSFLQALAQQPDLLLAHTGLGGVLAQAGLKLEAAESFRTAWLLDKTRLGDLAHCVFNRLHCAAWEGLEADLAALHQGLTGPQTMLPDPFAILACGLDAKDQRRAAERWAASLRKRVQPLRGPLPRWDGKRRVRLGYLSADWYSHATLILAIAALEAHDATRFELFVFDHGRDDGSPLRQRLQRRAEHWVGLHALSDFDAAQAIRAAQIDVLIDLKGYTANGRPGIAAHRPAPLQISHLAYPGTLGGQAHDYLIGDPVVTPLSHAAQFTECIAQMPHCYQPNDPGRSVPPAPPRAQLGLPEGAFVWASFNQIYKLQPAVFAVWTRLVHAVPGSVLWQMSGGAAADAHLRAHWQAAGLAPQQLVLAPKLGLDDHLARLQAADLHLDTHPVAGHTTAADALAAGLPLLALQGESYAARVSSSLLHALGLPDLVTQSLAGYEAQALRLAREPALLLAVRERLHQARASSPLFDAQRYARDFEALLLRMLERQRAGRKPTALEAHA
jgi:protein O-GlcNAc transferase